MNVTVVGCGYVGLVTAVGLASIGHRVVGVDIASERVAAINEGQPPFYEPDLAERLREALLAGAFRCTDNLPKAVADSDVIMLCVETPPRDDGSIDLSSLKRATIQVATAMTPIDRYQVVVVRSTVIPGTTQGLVRDILHRTASGRRADIGLVANPEFLREGSAVADFLSSDRIVIGATDRRSGDLIERLYAPLAAPIIRTNLTTAELIKYAANSILATLISFSNEIANICEQLGDVDVEDVLAGVRADRRWRMAASDSDATVSGIATYLKAGCGYGGGCLPKDVRALVAFARGHHYEPHLLAAVDAINRDRPQRLVDLAEAALGGSLTGRRVAVLGLAFKAGTDDLRESPGVAVTEELIRRSALVTAYDPLVRPEVVAPYLNGATVTHAGSLAEALSSADVCIITTNAAEFRALTTDSAVSLNTHRPVIVDGRRVLAKERFPDGGYVGIGWRQKYTLRDSS